MLYGIEGKTAIVTGVRENSLGFKVCEMLLDEGCNVMSTYHFDYGQDDNSEYLRQVEEQNKKHKAQMKVVVADVSKEEDIDLVFEETIKEFGEVDIIVNNAGIWPQALVKDMKVEDFRRTLDINLIGPFMLSKKFVNYCLDNNRKGKVINMSSQAAFHGSTSGHAHYAASKAVIVALTRSLAREVAPYGINVNAVAPGIMESKMVAYRLDKPEARQAYIDRIPLRKIASHEDVAKIVLFLCSNQSDYMTGTTLDASGGMMMR